MRRILYIHHGGEIGGAPLSLLYLLRYLDRSRYEPVVVALKPGPVVDLYRTEGIEVIIETGISDFSHTTLEWYGGRNLWRLPGKVATFWPSVQRTREVIRRLKPDLVHLNSSTLVPSAIACRREGIPVVWHIREPLTQGYLGLRRAWLRSVIDRTATRVIAICQNDADQLRPSDRIRVIYNFVHFAQFDRTLTGDAFRAEHGIPPESPVVTMLGGISEPKGTLVLIRALPDLVAAIPTVKVVIAGPLPQPPGDRNLKRLVKWLLAADAYEREVRRAIDRLDRQVRAALIFTGVRRDIPQVLAATTCLVFPSVVPHFARPIIEAAAMAVPCVASDLGGPRELVVHGKTGILVPPGDAGALAAGLSSVLRDQQHARAMGQTAYERARQMFDAHTNAAATVAVYDEMSNAD